MKQAKSERGGFFVISYPELGQHIPPLNIFRSETDLPESIVFVSIFSDIRKRNLKNPVFQSLRGNLFQHIDESKSQIRPNEQPIRK